METTHELDTVSAALRELAGAVAAELVRQPGWERGALAVRDTFDALVDAALGGDETLPRDAGRCVCGSTAGDEFHCADCGAEVGLT